ncbi:MAG: septation protein A [Patescibacteria group bacterium]|nr:septation protein A [Patescibacteria group bacterium]
MKLLFEFFPIVLFFITFKFFGIFIATGTAIGATLLQVAFVWVRKHKVENILWMNLAIITFFGGATILLQDETFIKLKPTVLYWAFAVTLLISRIVFKKNIMQSMMGKNLSMPEKTWDMLNLYWVVFFGLMGVLNLFVASRFSTDTWVNFKLFGFLGLTFLFIVVQSIMLAKYMKIKEETEIQEG